MDRQLEMVRDRIIHDNIKTVYVVARKIDSANIYIKRLKAWLNNPEIEYEVITTLKHMEGKKFYNTKSMFLLCGEWYFNDKIREEVVVTIWREVIPSYSLPNIAIKQVT